MRVIAYDGETIMGIFTNKEKAAKALKYIETYRAEYLPNDVGYIIQEKNVNILYEENLW